MKRYKYKIIEYSYTSMTYEKGKANIKYSKTLHKTNSKLLMYLIILCFKINKIEYDVVEEF